jgi:DNA-binding SARP family transcriptional activator/tetratricopeptide (TPR) repeat protein
MQGRLELFGVARWQADSRSGTLPDNLPGYLVAYLAYRGDWVGRESLVELFWPDRQEAEALHNLRSNLHRVRRLLADWSLAQSLQTEPRRMRLSLPTDVAAFRAAIGRGDWPAAAEMQREPLLSALSYKGFPVLEEWAQMERNALGNVWRSAALKAATQHETAGQSGLACDALLRLLRGSEPAEDAVQALLRVAGNAGRSEEALEQYERLRDALHEGAGAEPAARTVALADALRDPARHPAALTTASAVVPRGVSHPPRLIGRDAETALLVDPRVAVVVITGEPGVGKTRLLEEALPNAWFVACREELAQAPFGAIVELIEDQRDSLPDLGAARRELGRLVPSLLGSEQLPPANVAQAKPRLLAAIAHLFEARAAPVVFDDLQWADASTLELAVFMARRSPLRLCLAYRSSELHRELESALDAIDAATTVEHVRMAPLSAPQLTELLATVSRAETGPQLFSAWLHRRTGGNPFFALQTLRSLFESGQLAAQQDGWASALDEITADYSELRIPARIEDLVRRRIQAAPEDARRVLAAVAVVGDARAIAKVAAVAGLSTWACAEAIDALQAAALLQDLRFVHDLVRQSVYDATPQALRVVLHASVAREFAGTLRDENIAEHWWQAGEPAQAIAATIAASRSQRQAGLHDAARAAISRALGRAASSAQKAQLLALEARIRLEQGDFDGAEQSANGALDEAAAPRDRAGAYMVIASARMQLGRLVEAEAALANVAASDADYEGLCIERAKIAMLQDRAADAIPELESRCAHLRRADPGTELITALTSLGAVFDAQGDVARGLVMHEEAYRLAVKLDARYAQVEVAVNLVWALAGLGRNDEACRVAEEALGLGEYDSTPTLRNNLVWSLRELGRIDEAIRVCEQLAAGADPTLALIADARLIDMHARSGDPELPARIDAMLETMARTDVYAAHATAAKMVLIHGSVLQVDRVLVYLQPKALDPWLYEELSRALAARGHDPRAYLGAPPDPH